MKRFSRLAFPYLIWMIVLVGLPLLIMIALAFLDIKGIDFKNATFSIDHFQKTFSNDYIKAFLNSMELALIATTGCVILGYPVAYIFSRSKIQNKYGLLLILLLPMWTNMLVRITTINKMLAPNSIIKTIFGFGLNFSGSKLAIIIVMIIMYLPFMVFPIFTVLEKIDNNLLEASKDLGANNRKTFLKVTLPLSMKGVSSGIIMVFLPCAMGFAIPQIISEGNVMLIGNIIEQKFLNGTEYNVGSLISLVIILLVFGALYFISRVDEEGETLL